MTNAELVALLREAQPWLQRYTPVEATDLIMRIDAALAEHDAEERVEVDWALFPSFAVAKARLGTIDIRVFEEEAFREGASGFNVTLTLLKTFATLDEAKSAAIAAARGMR